MKNTSLELGKPQTAITSDNELVLAFPIERINNGYYDLSDLSISTEIKDTQNSITAQVFTFMPVIDEAETLNTTSQMRGFRSQFLAHYEGVFSISIIATNGAGNF